MTQDSKQDSMTAYLRVDARRAVVGVDLVGALLPVDVRGRVQARVVVDGRGA